MIQEDNTTKKEQDEQLREMNYDESQDIFEQQKPIPLDQNGEPITEDLEEENMEMNLDVPGSELDNNMENVGSEDEENNYYSLADQDDDHEEQDNDLE